MVKEKGKEIEVTTGETEFGVKIPPELPLQEEPKPPTAEETLQKELVELRAKYEQADKGLRSAQATLTQKDRLLKEKENLNIRIDSLEESMQILAGLIAKGATSGEISSEDANAYKQEFANLKKKRQEEEQKQDYLAKQEEYQNKLQEQVESYRQRVEALGLTEDNESYWEIYKLVTSATPADFKIADIKLKRMEKEKTPVDNKPTDEKDKTIETLQKEVERLKRVASGELDSETGRPSGASATEAQIRKTFRENPHNAKARADYLELMQTKK